MKIRTLVMALAAFSFMLTACGNQQANNNQDTEDQIETAVEEQADEFVNQIPVISGVWELAPIPVAAVEGMSDIKRVANAFCYEYSIYEPNKVLCDYLKDPDYNNEYFMLESMEENGYIACKGMTEYSNDVCCHIWDRDNGHKLVAFWLEEANENGDDTCLLAFYDFDPATNTMTPEPELAKKIVEPMAQYDAFSVRLPQEGVDAGLIGHNIDIEEDNYDNTYYMLRWNGNDFNQEQVTVDTFME